MKTKTNSKKSRILSTLAGTLLFGCIFIVNVMVFVRTGNVQGESIFTTLKAFAQSGSSGGSGSGSGCICPAGSACVAGICKVRETAYVEPCTKSKTCFPFKTVKTSGHEQTCRIDPLGATNCAAIPCDAQEPSCP